ncbi:MAG TPA: hypothetical protein VF594_08650 [Rubricoccaceae bacterium]|jgi:predicted esterase
MTVRHIAAVKTARYVVLGPEDGPVREVWMACHGYGQLAAYFARHFRAVEAPGRLVIVPEGLSRFYLDGGDGGRYERVGASWATRDAREADIADTNRYLDDVFVAVCARAEAEVQSVPVVGFGFSQGTATVTRWIAQSPLMRGRAERVRRLVLWGGGLPHDLDLTAEAGWLSAADLALVAGDRDGIATPARVLEQERRMTAAGLPHRVVSFAGEHRLNDRVLRSLA